MFHFDALAQKKVVGFFAHYACCSPLLFCTDLSHSETRLSIYLDSFELHVYNRSSNYLHLEKLFGLDKLQTSHPDQPPDEVKKYEAMHTLVIEFHVALCVLWSSDICLCLWLCGIEVNFSMTEHGCI